MRRSIFVSLSTLCLALVAGLCSCSSDDESDELKNNQATFRTENYSIGYSLRNEKGKRSTTFNEGENIIFEVTVYNNTGYELHLADERDILMKALSVFRSDGEYVGNPWETAFYTMELRWLTVEARGSLHWSSSWIYDSSQVRSSVEPLPKGDYYLMVKSRIMYRVVDDPTPGGGSKGHNDMDIKIPFTVM